MVNVIRNNLIIPGSGHLPLSVAQPFPFDMTAFPPSLLRLFVPQRSNEAALRNYVNVAVPGVVVGDPVYYDADLGALLGAGSYINAGVDSPSAFTYFGVVQKKTGVVANNTKMSLLGNYNNVDTGSNGIGDLVLFDNADVLKVLASLGAGTGTITSSIAVNDIAESAWMFWAATGSVAAGVTIYRGYGGSVTSPAPSAIASRPNSNTGTNLRVGYHKHASSYTGKAVSGLLGIAPVVLDEAGVTAIYNYLRGDFADYYGITF
ncbi:hypothetical protein MUO32_05105 [Shinella sp. CPCC 101442]|uniref:hypothetical protein n=1 Tax=Shinella sp. CPCC 101442 TaxID=2932265 RepID=UPI002152EAAD|nr:hypothetical protein [Shinella sp. CPCC 101442]MCR6498405.1 hypothetical protein [Shinella sp. CPCC 101442]